MISKMTATLQKTQFQNATETKTVPDKPVIVKETLKLSTLHFGIPKIENNSPSKEKLAALKKIDDDKRETEKSRNNLESYVINMKVLLEEDGRKYF